MAFPALESSTACESLFFFKFGLLVLFDFAPFFAAELILVGFADGFAAFAVLVTLTGSAFLEGERGDTLLLGVFVIIDV
jgi:hypothetical protein